MESNVFKTVPEPFLPGAVVLLGTLGLGLVAVVAAFAVDPLGPPVVLLIWTFFLGGLLLTFVPGRTRSLGIGLVIAGAALPLGAFTWLWVVVSLGVLGGSVT